MKKIFAIFSLMAFLILLPMSVSSDYELVSCCLKGCG